MFLTCMHTCIPQNPFKPVLTLNGAARIVIEATAASTYTDLGATATDPQVRASL